MQPCEAAAAQDARRMTSSSRWEACVFPAHTIRPEEGLINVPLGRTTSIGARQPWFMGISVLIRRQIV